MTDSPASATSERTLSIFIVQLKNNDEKQHKSLPDFSENNCNGTLQTANFEAGCEFLRTTDCHSRSLV
jgi:hypothetical protein